MNPDPLRVAIVDDHPMFRLGLAAAIGEMAGMIVAGEAERVADVPDLVARSSPDLLLLDVALPDGSGLDVNRWLNEHHPSVRVVMLTMSEDLDDAMTAIRDGASGYLVKGAGPERVEHALRTAVAGDVVLDQGLVDGVAELTQARRTAAVRPFPELTDREFDVLQLVAEGLDNGAIARRLVVSPKTVRNHVSNIFAKLQTTDRPGAIVLAHRQGSACRARVMGIGTIDRVAELTLERAQHVLRAAQDDLERSGGGAAIAVVDAHGELIAFARTGGCPLPSIQNAINKAYTAARERKPSREIGDAARAERFPITNFGDLRYTGWGGGVPLVVDRVVVGAIGISGLPEEDDMRLAAKAASTLTG